MKRLLTPKWSKYIPEEAEFFPKQILALLMQDEELMMSGTGGSGKAIRLTEKIFTPKGWTTFEHIHVGDILYDQNGKETTVLGEYFPEITSAYELTFSNGQTIVCCGDHLWSVQTDADKKNGTQQTLTTIELTKSFYKCRRKPNWALIPRKPIEGTMMPFQNFLYEMGRLIGDTNGSIFKPYFNSSVKQRLLLLQGINDSRSKITKIGSVKYVAYDKNTLNDYCALLSTLAIEYHVETKTKTYEMYVVKYKTELPVFRNLIGLKKQKQTNFSGSHNRVYITSYRELPIEPMKCIKVDSPESTFLIGEKMIVTHNSFVMLSMALQYADHPKFEGLILMRNYGNLETLINQTREWLPQKGCDWNEQKKTWTFPEGGRLKFGNLNKDNDYLTYKGPEYNFIGYDELTRFNQEIQYTYLFSRLRRTLSMMDIPLRVRSATNPGDVGGPWVRARFIDPETRVEGANHIFFDYRDNPFLDRDSYERQLLKLPYLERQYMMHGDWYASTADAFIKPEWFNVIPSHQITQPRNHQDRVRVWDIAATVESKKNRDPDYTAGALCSTHNGTFTVEEIIYLRGSPRTIEEQIVNTYYDDNARFGTNVNTRIEMGMNSGSKIAIDQLLRGPFSGMEIRPLHSNVSKQNRARPFAVAAENGLVQIVSGGWNKQFFEECTSFDGSGKKHDDGLDAVSYCYSILMVNKQRKASITSFATKFGDTRPVDGRRTRYGETKKRLFVPRRKLIVPSSSS